MQNKVDRILILGAKGMLGSDLVDVLSNNAYQVIPLDIEELDITEKVAVTKIMFKERPEIVINCAAYTDVDGCETNIKTAFSVNAEGVKNIAIACNLVKAKLIHFSTDYIFDGAKNEPYIEDDTPNPINVYGQSKLMSEKYIKDIMKNYIIIRTQWLFGKNGKNFVSTILRLTEQKDELQIVNDQIGAPTYTKDLAEATKELISNDAKGIFNVTNSGYCSWYEFTREIVELVSKKNIKIIAISSQELNRPAKRPKNSLLDGKKFYAQTKFRMPHWQNALKRYLEEKESLLCGKIS